jgi:dihydrofolate synthase/folylpolyglutamate synthase
VTERSLADVEAALTRRWPESVLDPTLDRVRDVLDLLGSPQTAYPVVLVAGTNGKTSTARMADALLRELGLRVGRYTSPHLERVTERISLDGVLLSDEAFVRAYEEVAPFLELVDAKHDHPLSYFETLTVMAYAVFADAPVDVAVVEVGMGGTWDATNVVDPAVAVVTPIGLDHQAYLGDTIELIAGEKAGIVKDGGFAVLAQQDVAAAEVLLRRAAEVGATVAREGLEFGVLSRALAVGGQLLDLKGLAGTYDEVLVPLLGPYQAHNASVALAAVEAFLGGGREQLDVEAVRAGFASVRSPGRLEVVRRGPTVLLDVAHNPAGAAALAESLVEDFSFRRLVAVVGMLADKDARGLLEVLEPVVDQVVATQSTSPRALPADDLGAVAVDVLGADRVSVAPRLPDAIEEALTLAEEDGALGGSGVLVTGSVVTVGEARVLLHRDRSHVDAYPADDDEQD